MEDECILYSAISLFRLSRISWFSQQISSVKMIRLIVLLAVLQIWIINSEAATTALPRNRQRGSGIEGKYKPEENKWAYKPDNRGKYVHIHIPYDGGYGPFRNPYDHLDNPYKHLEPKHEDDPFSRNYFDDKKPAIYREYGAPLFGS